MPVKITVSLHEDVVKALKQLANKHGISMTEALRRAIATEAFLDEEVASGSRLLIERKNETPREILVR